MSISCEGAGSSCAGQGVDRKAPYKDTDVRYVVAPVLAGGIADIDGMNRALKRRSEHFEFLRSGYLFPRRDFRKGWPYIDQVVLCIRTVDMLGRSDPFEVFNNMHTPTGDILQHLLHEHCGTLTPAVVEGVGHIVTQVMR